MKLDTLLSGLLLLSTLCLGASQAHAVETDATTPDQVFAAYAPVQAALVVDDLAKAQEGAKALRELAAQWLSENPGHAQLAGVAQTEKGAAQLAASESLDDARLAFVTVSQGTIAFIRTDKTLQSKWQLYHCPMVSKDRGYWVQPVGEEIGNPFMGSAMPACGSKKPW